MFYFDQGNTYAPSQMICFGKTACMHTWIHKYMHINLQVRWEKLNSTYIHTYIHMQRIQVPIHRNWFPHPRTHGKRHLTRATGLHQSILCLLGMYMYVCMSKCTSYVCMHRLHPWKHVCAYSATCMYEKVYMYVCMHARSQAMELACINWYLYA